VSERPTFVACPTCGKSVEWAPRSTWRPFCSKRCKTVDLGAWATEQYRVPVAEEDDRLDADDPRSPRDAA